MEEAGMNKEWRSSGVQSALVKETLAEAGERGAQSCSQEPPFLFGPK